MKTKILELRQLGKNSEEISEILNVSKLDIDLILIQEHHSDKELLSIEDWKHVIEDKHSGMRTKDLVNKYKVCNAVLSKKFKTCGVVFLPENRFDRSLLTKETVDDLINDFRSGVPVYKLVDKYGFNKDVLAKCIKDRGIIIHPPTFNINMFDSIDTEEKAYWLGFLYADGSISSKDNGCELGLQLIDAEHIYKFISFLKSENPIRLDFKRNRCRCNICNSHFKNRLIELGCTPQKSLTLKFPNTEWFSKESLVIPFIRGYFDGDGCLTHTYSDTKKQRFTISCGIIGTESFLKDLQKILKKYNIDVTMYHDKHLSKETLELQFNKTNSVKLVNLLYRDASIYLTRKFEKYKFFANSKNFAVYVSDYIDYNRAISEKAKQWINNHFNIDYDAEQANAEITKKSNDFLES